MELFTLLRTAAASGWRRPNKLVGGVSQERKSIRRPRRQERPQEEVRSVNANLLESGTLSVGTKPRIARFVGTAIAAANQEGVMGRGILLWLIGVPIPIIVLLALFFH
jgi:hypothetical protein